MTTRFTDGDVAAMVREATRRANARHQELIGEFMQRDRGDLQTAEDLLAVLALSRILRHRVEIAARQNPQMRPLAVRLDEYVDRALQLAEKLSRTRRAQKASKGG